MSWDQLEWIGLVYRSSPAFLIPSHHIPPIDVCSPFPLGLLSVSSLIRDSISLSMRASLQFSIIHVAVIATLIATAGHV